MNEIEGVDIDVTLPVLGHGTVNRWLEKGTGVCAPRFFSARNTRSKIYPNEIRFEASQRMDMKF